MNKMGEGFPIIIQAAQDPQTFQLLCQLTNTPTEKVGIVEAWKGG